ncbi:SDR family oxidoreductase [Acerihabitans sp. KWT182]|uniref:SDR family oxidoreductase n=1 Tax=Acerihabitans sp. KWT182 TaxID=3157919 RepID=A0AAU7Q5L6_9GAMM
MSHIKMGDLAEPDFGMPPQAYRTLRRQVDSNYHSAGAVNFIRPYSPMKRDNVQGLQEIIRFAAQGHKRRQPMVGRPFASRL